MDLMLIYMCFERDFAVSRSLKKVDRTYPTGHLRALTQNGPEECPQYEAYDDSQPEGTAEVGLEPRKTHSQQCKSAPLLCQEETPPSLKGWAGRMLIGHRSLAEAEELQSEDYP